VCARLSGPRPGAIRDLITEFRQNFSKGALPRILLPANQALTRPYVAPDGALPNPASASLLALRHLMEQDPPKEENAGSASSADALYRNFFRSTEMGTRRVQ
ncbi:unnamed protein product, partial [Effrenium voratum]